MSYRISKRPKARLDFWEIVSYLLAQNVSAAERFADAVEESLRFLSQWPESGERMDDGTAELEGVRLFQMQGFPKYLIVFRLKNDRVEVLRFTHASRDLDALLRESD